MSGNLVLVALAGSDDGAEVLSLRAAALESCRSSGKIVGKNVSKSLVEAVGTLEGSGSLCIVAVENVDNSLVLSVAGSSECLLGSSEVTIAESDDTLGGLEVSILGLNLCECLLSLAKLTLLEINYAKVELCAVAVVLVDSLLVDSLFCIEILNEGCRAEKSLLVENVAVLLNELEKLLGGVVLLLNVGNESCAAELRENFLLEDSVNLGHVLDLALADCRIAVH